MTCHLKREMPVPTLKHKLVGWRPPNRQSTQHERPSGEPKRLSTGLPLLTYQTNALSLLQLLLRDNEFTEVAEQNWKVPKRPLSGYIFGYNRLVLRVLEGGWPEWPKVLKLNQLGVGCGGMI